MLRILSSFGVILSLFLDSIETYINVVTLPSEFPKSPNSPVKVSPGTFYIRFERETKNDFISNLRQERKYVR